MTTNPNTDTDTIIGLLDDLNKRNAADVWVPSLGKTVQFKQMTATHQKDVIRTLATTQYFPSAMTITMYEIVKSTILDKQVDVDQLTMVDKIAIMMGIRAYNIGDEVALSDAVYADDKKPVEQPVKISLTGHLESVRKGQHSLTVPDATVSTGQGLSVTVCIPSFRTEHRFESYLYDLLRQSNEAEARQALATIYISTIAQFIRTVTVGDQEPFSFEQHMVQDCMKVVQQLPQKLVALVNEELNAISDVIAPLTHVATDFEGRAVAGSIPTDGTFFMAG